MRKTHKALALAAALTLVVGVAPVAAQDEPTVPEAPATELAYQGEIDFWNTMRDFEMAEVQRLVDAWQDAHPGITVNHEPQSFDDAQLNYTLAAQAGNAPDILRADIGWTIGFADEGFLMDMTPFITDAEDWLEVPVETATWQGSIWGLPQVTDALGLQCNQELLTEAGLDTAPATWEELVSAGTEFADLQAQRYGFYTRADAYWAQPFTWAWGGRLYEVADDGSVEVLINSPESVAGWNFLRDEILGTVAPATWSFPDDYGAMTAGFKAGDIMCVMNGPWQVADHLEGAAFADDPSNLVIAPLPEGPDGDTGSPVGGHNYVVYALVEQDPDRQAAVLDFLSYIDGTEAQVYLAQTLGLLPTRLSAYEDPAVQADPIISAWGEVMQRATNRAGHPRSPDIYEPYSNNYQAFLTGEVTAEEALANIEAAWNQLFGN
jgi:arabinogalactan oligomer / maltooligosaccharide transport system substrate-binding protein